MRILHIFTLFHWQLLFTSIATLVVGICISQSDSTGVDILSLDRATFITSLSGIASILALFCSISFAFVLFVSQSNKSERVAAFDQFKSRLLTTQQWLLSQPKNGDRELCLDLVFKLDRLDLCDLPQTNYGPQYSDYTAALEESLEGNNEERRQFFITSILYIGYLEQLLSRIGLIAVRQIIAKCFIDTLAKGVGIICLSITVLIAAVIWYSDLTRSGFVVAGVFCGISTIFLFYEFCYDIYREYKEELDFVDSTGSSSES